MCICHISYPLNFKHKNIIILDSMHSWLKYLAKVNREVHANIMQQMPKRISM